MAGIEEALSKLVPNPTQEDAADMMSIAFAYARIVDRRAAKLQGKLGVAKEKIANLLAVREVKEAEAEAPEPDRVKDEEED